MRVEKGKDGDMAWHGICGFLYGGSSLDPATTTRIHINPMLPAENSVGFFVYRQGAPPANVPRGYSNVRWHHDDFGYKIDLTASPKTIDLYNIELNGRSQAALGIYEIEGNQMKLRLAWQIPEFHETRWPKDFTIEPNSADILFVLKRYSDNDEKTLEGSDWKLASRMVVDGKADQGKQDSTPYKFIAYGVPEDTTAFGMGGGEDSHVYKMRYLVDSTRQPKRITLITKNGMDESGRLDGYGIYRFDNNQLTIAFRTGGPCPEKLESTPGSGVILMILEKKPPASKQGTSGLPKVGSKSTSNTAGAAK